MPVTSVGGWRRTADWRLTCPRTGDKSGANICSCLAAAAAYNNIGFRYIRVRYEDIVDDTIATLTRVYNHLNLPFTKHVENVAFARTHAENITGTNGSEKGNFSKQLNSIFRKGYYNTFRGSSFAHDSWKKKLHLAHIQIIEKGCEKFMSANNYEKFAK